MLETLVEVGLLVNRYVHIVCTTILVGGTLFYEMIVPVAIGELKHEQQMLVFGRARWTFKGVVWTCTILLLISGAISTARRWREYTSGPPAVVAVTISGAAAPVPRELLRPGYWWASHAISALLALGIAVLLTSPRRPPDQPIFWMRINFAILLIVIFLGSATRHVRVINTDSERLRPPSSDRPPILE